MSSRTLIELVGHIVFSFTRGVTEHYNPEEPEFTPEFFGYNPLESTEREWNHQPVDEFIYQEYGREATALDNLASRGVHVRVIDACSPEENEETQENEQDDDSAMAWKRLRPSALRTVCKSMYIGALISLLPAFFVGTLFMLVSYICYKTMQDCQFYRQKSIPVKVQWARTISQIISSTLTYIWFFVSMRFLLRPYQLKGVKRRIFLVSFLTYGLDAVYRVSLQALGISHSHISTLQNIPLNIIFLSNIGLQIYVLTIHFCRGSRRQKLTFFFQMSTPNCLCLFVVMTITYCIYPAYNKQNSEGKLLIALFAPLIGVVAKVISRISVQRLWKTIYPGYLYVLLAPFYFGTAVMFRVLQADLDSLQSIAILGVIHGAAEVIERSTMIVIDHICHTVRKRQSAPWGSFRTPRRERLMADLAITSMLSESTAIVSVNSYLYLYQFMFLKSNTIIKLLESFAITTSVQLVIEWFFTSVSLAIETRYQNMAVMAVWRRRWKRHIFMTIVNAIPFAVWASTNLLVIVHGRFQEALNDHCKMPFS